MKSSISELPARQEKILYGNIESVVLRPLSTMVWVLLVESSIPFT